MGAALGHAFRQDAATATDIQHFFTLQTGTSIDVIQPQRINFMQRLEFAMGIPPACCQCLEFVNFAKIDVVLCVCHFASIANSDPQDKGQVSRLWA